MKILIIVLFVIIYVSITYVISERKKTSFYI